MSSSTARADNESKEGSPAVTDYQRDACDANVARFPSFDALRSLLLVLTSRYQSIGAFMYMYCRYHSLLCRSDIVFRGQQVIDSLFTFLHKNSPAKCKLVFFFVLPSFTPLCSIKKLICIMFVYA